MRTDALRQPAALGIRDASRTLEFRASYAFWPPAGVPVPPADSMELEIKPYALAR